MTNTLKTLNICFKKSTEKEKWFVVNPGWRPHMLEWIRIKDFSEWDELGKYECLWLLVNKQVSHSREISKIYVCWSMS